MSVELESDGREFDFTKERLSHVYEFAAGKIGHSKNNLDIGLFDSFASRFFPTFADHTVSIDLNPKMLQRSLENKQTAALIKQGKLSIAQMNATQLGFKKDSFTSATCIEVFGAGFTGEHEDVNCVFKSIYEALEPGSKLVFTTKSSEHQNTLAFLARYLAFDEIFSHPNQHNKGYPLYRQEVEEIIAPLFGSVDWYGHFYFQKQGNNMLFPIPLNDKDDTYEVIQQRFQPKVIDESSELAFYHIGVCQKPY